MFRNFGVAALMGAAAACSDAPTGTSAADAAMVATLDVASVAGDQAAEDVSLMIHNEGAFGNRAAALPRFGPWMNDCTFSSASGDFGCPMRRVGTLDMSRSYAFFDGNGDEQNSYDPITTASAHFEITITGTATRAGFEATFSHERSLTVSGLEGSESTHIVNGTASSSQERSRHTEGGRSRSYETSATGSIASVVIPFPRTAGSWPLSGSITRDVSFTRENYSVDSRTGSRHVEVTFNGTQHVPLSVNGVSFTLDLATGRPVRDE